jgi:hypothetical protein
MPDGGIFEPAWTASKCAKSFSGNNYQFPDNSKTRSGCLMLCSFSPTRSAILTGLSPARTGITSPACHLEDRMAKEAVAFMEKHQNEPFYLNCWNC